MDVLQNMKAFENILHLQTQIHEINSEALFCAFNSL
jgi:hypothetical protein